MQAVTCGAIFVLTYPYHQSSILLPFNHADTVLAEDLAYAPHVRRSALRELVRTAREKDLEPGRGRDDPMTAGRFADVAEAVHRTAREVHHAAGTDFRPLTVRKITDAPLDDEEDLILPVVDMHRRSAARGRDLGADR